MTQFQKSTDTAVCETNLRECQVGGMITYDSLSKALGRDVREFCFSNLLSARKILEKEGIVFGVEKNVGLKRLNDSEIVKTSDQTRLQIKRKTNRQLLRLANVKYEELSDDDKRKHIADSAMLGALSLFSKSSTQKKIEANVDKSSIPIGDTLKLFS